MIEWLRLLGANSTSFLDHQSWLNWGAPVRSNRSFGRLMLDDDRDNHVLRRAFLAKHDEY